MTKYAAKLVIERQTYMDEYKSQHPEKELLNSNFLDYDMHPLVVILDEVTELISQLKQSENGDASQDFLNNVGTILRLGRESNSGNAKC